MSSMFRFANHVVTKIVDFSPKSRFYPKLGTEIPKLKVFDHHYLELVKWQTEGAAKINLTDQVLQYFSLHQGVLNLVCACDCYIQVSVTEHCAANKDCSFMVLN